MAMKTVRCYEIKGSNLLWEEMVTYDTDYWDYDDKKRIGFIYYIGKNIQVPKKPDGMLHCPYTFSKYKGTHLDLSSFDTSNVIDMRGMFKCCYYLQSLDLSSFDTSNVTNMSWMFDDCKSLKSLDLSSFDTSNVVEMGYMFDGCISLQSLDLSSFDTSNVTNMSCMFYNCKSLQSLDLSSFNTSNVEGMGYMFCTCESLKSLDLSNFNTSNVEGMYYMFCGCKSLKELDLSSFDTSSVTDMNRIFENTNLTKKSTGLGLFSKNPKKPIRQSMKLKGNVSLDDISKEIDRLYHDGNIPSSKVLINSLRDSGFSDSNIVSCIFNRVESGFLDRDIYMPVVNSYIEKYIQPEIVRNLSSKSVGEVLDLLYSRYSESIVNKAMCSYLSPHYLVD